MRRVELVDTSILVEILDVPGRNSNRAAVMEDFRSRRADTSLDLLLQLPA